MTITQILNVLETAIADAEAQRKPRLPWRRSRAVVVHMTAPRVLGELGQADGVDEAQRPVYGYTLKQCRAIRATILAAAREDHDALGAL